MGTPVTFKHVLIAAAASVVLWLAWTAYQDHQLIQLMDRFLTQMATRTRG